MTAALVWIQAATFVGLAIAFAHAHEWRLAVAQACLAVVTVVVYL